MKATYHNILLIIKKPSRQTRVQTPLTAIAAVSVLAVLLITLASCNNEQSMKPENSLNPGQGTAAPGDTSAPGDTADVINLENASPIPELDFNNVDLAATIARFPDQRAFTYLFTEIGGYWVTSNDMYVFFGFFNGIPGVVYGQFDTGYPLNGTIVDSRATGTLTATLTIHIPAIQADSMNVGRPESTVIVNFDLSRYEENLIKIQVEGFGNGDWYSYKYGGFTLEEARNNR
ncbi:MAG: hypothetical protein LBU61_01475 [Coriobacteriales bacterium]|jgi:hypothetical protein|nr:hypothetical protein [Coriobacteriales bacterium]